MCRIFIFPKIPKKRYFWGTIFFLISIFTMFPTLRQLLTYQKCVLETCTFKICVEIFVFTLFSNSKWRLKLKFKMAAAMKLVRLS